MLPNFRAFCLVLLVASLALPAGCGGWGVNPDDPFQDDGFAPRTARQKQELRDALEMLRARARSGEGAARRDRSDEPAAAQTLPVEVLRPSHPPALDDEGRLRRSAVLRVVNRGAHDFIRHVRLEPHYVSGQMTGYRIAQVDDGASWVLESGVRLGDVVRRVNGRAIHTPDGFMAAWDAARERSRITVDLLRDGQELGLAWDIVDEPSAQAQSSPR